MSNQQQPFDPNQRWQQPPYIPPPIDRSIAESGRKYRLIAVLCGGFAVLGLASMAARGGDPDASDVEPATVLGMLVVPVVLIVVAVVFAVKASRASRARPRNHPQQ